MMQTTITLLTIAAACGYAGWRVYDTFRKASDPCYGCAGCPLKAQKQRDRREKCERKTQKTA